MNVCIIGLGLIGGSLAIQLKKNGFATYISGVECNRHHAKIALKRGLVNEIINLEEAVYKSDIVILAVAADITIKLLPEILNIVNHQIVIDVCSIKRKVCDRVSNHINRKNFVSTHPMAGTENSGPQSAIENLFDDKAVVFVDKEKSSNSAIKLISEMYSTLNMRITYMNSVEHDMHAAYVSHISHVSSMALALTVIEKEKNEKDIFDLASGGFDSTVRLAKSSSEMWTSIFINNSDNILFVIEEYINQLSKFKKSIEDGNKTEIDFLIKNANTISKILKS